MKHKYGIDHFAEQVGFPTRRAFSPLSDLYPRLERFAALIEAAKEAEFAERLRTDVHSCGPACQRVICVAVREAVQAERESLAKVCDEAAKAATQAQQGPADDLVNVMLRHHAVAHTSSAAAIRARGNT
jgi:hypothetical protein